MQSKKLLAAIIASLVMAPLIASVAVPCYAQVFTIHHIFDKAAGNPASKADQGRDGDLYGGFSNAFSNCVGGVYRLPTTGQGSAIYQAPGPGWPNCWAAGDLTLATDGNFYGPASGGTYDKGTLFKITRGGVLTVLYNFTGGADGAGP